MSSSDTAISIRGLSKAYTIAHGAPKRPTFRDVVMERVRHPFRRPQRETFWALKDVSFDVKKGEVVGIIGRNGAGKSTLLKILSRITEPTAGRIELYGRVGSLLEVGTGFHPELTGRENVFLNGAILGMSRGEIRKQFDAIVDFAEVERFLETPVKRYSSGMYVRLAFAVAAHLNPEILVIDEVLAVGDAEFQRKCLGKMGEVAKGGRTVLFVSHNMQAMRLLCSTAKLLDEGTLVFDGTVEQCTRLYGDIRQHCGQQICTNAIVMDPAIAVTSVEVNGSASSWQTLPGDCRVLTLAVSGTAAHACRADIEVRFHDQYRTPLGFFSPGYDRGAGETIGPGKFTLVRAASLPRLNRCTLVLDIDIVWPGVCYFVRMRSALTLTAEGAPTTTGKVFDSDKGAGWVFLQDVAGTRISDQDEGTGDRGSEQ